MKKIEVYIVSELIRYTYENMDIDNILHIVTRDKEKAIEMLEDLKHDYEKGSYFNEIDVTEYDNATHYNYYDENGDGGTISFEVHEV